MSTLETLIFVPKNICMIFDDYFSVLLLPSPSFDWEWFNVKMPRLLQ